MQLLFFVLNRSEMLDGFILTELTSISPVTRT